MLIYCDVCEENVDTDTSDVWETVYVRVVDGHPCRAGVEVDITCKKCDTMLLNGDGWLDLWKS